MQKVLFILFLIPAVVFSQTTPKIDTDRPDQTECTSTVPKGYFQIENGFTYIADKSKLKTTLLPTSLWKIGVNDHFELRMITEPQTNEFEGASTFGIPPVKFGFKSRLVEGKGILPNISFIGHISNPYLSTDNLRESNFNPDFRFTLDNKLSEKFSIGYNIGMAWEDKLAEPIFQYTCALGYVMNEKWKCYIELFGDKPQKEDFQLSTSAGIYYYPKPDIMFDITGAYGLANTTLDYYSALGVSFLIPMKK